MYCYNFLLAYLIINLERLLIRLYLPLGLWQIVAITGCPLKADKSQVLSLWTAIRSGVLRGIHGTHQPPLFHVHHPPHPRG